MIDEEKIRRINELSRNAKSPEGLTEEEIRKKLGANGYSQYLLIYLRIVRKMLNWLH